MLTLLMSISSWGAKAFPGPYTFTQPDDTELSVTLHGDEYFSYYTTLDGVILVREGDTFYIAEISDDGDIKATGVLAHNNGARSSSEIALIQQQDKGKLFNRNTIKRAIRKVPVAGGSPKYTPHTGSPNIVVILAEFQDVKFSVNEPINAFDDLFNASSLNDYGNQNTRNIGSVKRYFKMMSTNEFKPNFQIVGPVTLSQNRKYYGGSNKAPNDEKATALAEEAVDSVMKLGYADLNSNEYDADNDGNVDLVYIIYAGHMQNMGGPNESVWAKASYTYHSIGTKKVRRYCMSGELLHPNASGYIASIGVICHEFSHCLGLPDLYVTSAYYADNQEMELWDLMDGGENLHNGWQPTAYTAWEKEAMDWPVKIQNLSAENSSGDLSTPTTDGGTVYRIVNPDDANEYIMLENIKKEGWNMGCYVAKGTTGGILAYHMKYPNSTVSMGDDPNCQANPALAVIPADGLLESIDLKDQTINGVLRTDSTYKASHKGDLFNNVNGLQISDDLNLPNFCWYSGSETIDGYTDRFKTNKSVSFTFEGDNITVNYVDDVAGGETPLEPTDISQLDNAIYVDPVETARNCTYALNIKAKNNVTMAGMGFTLTVPEGFYLDTAGDGIFNKLDSQRAISSQFMVMTSQDGNAYTFNVMPTSTTAISGNDGTVLTVRLKNENAELGIHELKISDAIYSVRNDDNSYETLDVADVISTIDISDEMLGDVNGDNRMDLTDAIMIVNHSLNNTPSNFKMKVADVNGDGNIDLTDAIIVVNRSMSNSSHARQAFFMDFDPE